MMSGFDDMVTVKSNYTDQNGVHYGQSDVNRGGYHASTATALEYAYLTSPDFTDTDEVRKSFLKRKQDSNQTIFIGQHLTLSEKFRPLCFKAQRCVCVCVCVCVYLYLISC